MRAAGSITWLLLSLSLFSTSISTLETTAATTSKSVTIPNPTTAKVTTAQTTVPQTTTTEATTLAKTTAFSKTTQLMTTAATTTKSSTAATTNKPEPTPAPTPTTGAKSSISPAAPASPAALASTSADHQTTGTISPPVVTATSQSRSTAQITPATKSPSPHPSGVSNLPSADYSSNGPTLSTGTPTPSKTTEQAPTKIITKVVTMNQQEISSGTRAGSSGLTSPEAKTTMKTNLASTTSSQTKAGSTDAGSFQSTAGNTVLSTITANLDPQKFTYSLLGAQKADNENHFPELCQQLMLNLLNGTCTVTWRSIKNKVYFDSVEINGKVNPTLAEKYYEEITKADAQKTDDKKTDYKTLIAILASCGALLIMIIILTVCASHHRKPCSENQQYLTEELHTVENCYHDNPTLEVMEAQPEMQEKKVALNGEFNDSWIVPIDNLMKEDVLDEEDTHL